MLDVLNNTVDSDIIILYFRISNVLGLTSVFRLQANFTPPLAIKAQAPVWNKVFIVLNLPLLNCSLKETIKNEHNLLVKGPL